MGYILHLNREYPSAIPGIKQNTPTGTEQTTRSPYWSKSKRPFLARLRGLHSPLMTTMTTTTTRCTQNEAATQPSCDLVGRLLRVKTSDLRAVRCLFSCTYARKKRHQLQLSSTHLSTHSSSSKVSHLKTHVPGHRKGDVACLNLYCDNQSFRVYLAVELHKKARVAFDHTRLRCSTNVRKALLWRGEWIRFRSSFFLVFSFFPCFNLVIRARFDRVRSLRLCLSALFWGFASPTRVSFRWDEVARIDEGTTQNIFCRDSRIIPSLSYHARFYRTPQTTTLY